MSHRWIVAVLAVSALLLGGCGGGKVSSTTSNAKPSSEQSSSGQSSAATAPSSAAGPQQKLDARACTDVTGANLDLTVATTAGDAQKAADAFAKYHPPADVQEAIDHFVKTNGARFDDPDYDKYNGRINSWVEAICPV
jgi:hypothetical protein